jgi:hypothetical protein
MMALRRSVRRGSVWVDHSLSFRERDQMLIPPQQWALHRQAFIDQLGLPERAAEFIKPLIATLVAGLWGVVGAVRRGQVEIGMDGMLHLSKLAAMSNDREPRRTREAIYRSIGAVQFPDVILEVDAATNFSDTLLGHRARSNQELLCWPWTLHGNCGTRVSICVGAPTPLASTRTCATAGASSMTSPSCSTSARPAWPSRASSSSTASKTASA